VRKGLAWSVTAAPFITASRSGCHGSLTCRHIKIVVTVYGDDVLLREG